MVKNANRPNQLDAGNGSEGICRVINVMSSPPPDLSRRILAINHGSPVNGQSSFANVMKRLIALCYSCCALTACSSVIQPPLDQAAALSIARQTIARRERWPQKVQVHPNITQSVCYQTTKSAEGSWTVTAHKCVWENDSGNMAFEPDTKRVLIISDAGEVIRYSRVLD